MKHMILIYGGLGDLASRRIIPALNEISSELSIGFALVDCKVTCTVPGKYYRPGEEPLSQYNAAIISTPNDAHKDIAIKALNFGMHILCEKPLAHTLEAAREIVEAANKHPAQVAMLSDHYTYKPAVREVIQKWAQYKARIGKIGSIKAKVLEPSSVEGREWLLQKGKSGGGVIMDTGIHLVSIMGRLFGYDKMHVTKATVSRYEGAPGNSETFGYIALNVDDIPIEVEVGKMMADTEKGIVFSGDKRQLEIDIEREQVKLNGMVEASFAEDDSYLAILKEFFSAIEDKRTSWTTLNEGYEAQRIIDAVYEIAKWEVPKHAKIKEARIGG
ncbi:Inositol 2-dehydrogenase/D-chiro-inositol 3-dehydrogenase [subsurface metagenome]